MTAWPPRCERGPAAWLLQGAAGVYGAAVALRNLAYDRGWIEVRRLPAKVASVGNLTVGGTGKTPTALYLARLLVESGRRPAILSRGYGGGHARRGLVSGGPLVVGDGGGEPLAGPDEAGDEPVLLARRAGVPVVVAADRVAAGRLAIERFGADTLVLDDGLQHRRLGRDLEVVLIDAGKGLDNGRLLPAGPLREPPSALRRAHVLLLTKGRKSGRSDALLQAILAFAPQAVAFGASYRPVALAPLGGASPPLDGNPPHARQGNAPRRRDASAPPPREEPAPVSLAGARALALSGLADPASFHESLAGLGAREVLPLSFPDHHRYGPADYRRIAVAAARADCLVTTEKDAVKLDVARLPPLPAFTLEVALEPDDPAGFAAACLARLGVRP